MKSEKENENEEFDINEYAITLKTDDEVIDKIHTGEITNIRVQLNEDTQSELIEFVDGNPVLDVEESPSTNYGCYFYNGGEFPYVIRPSLGFLIIRGDEGVCLSRIIDIDTKPGTRFNYQGADKPIVEDPNGDSCIWTMSFEIVPYPQDPKTYLMRWNPATSSFTEKDFEECMENRVHGLFRMDWSIYEWQEARRAHFFYMMRTGDDKAGIVFRGQFLSDPYPDDDWAGSTKRRMYVDMICYDAESDSAPLISLEKLQAAIPSFDWSKGHSGELLSEEITAQMDELWGEEL
jgi:hypothetical protein